MLLLHTKCITFTNSWVKFARFGFFRTKYTWTEGMISWQCQVQLLVNSLYEIYLCNNAIWYTLIHTTVPFPCN